MPRKKTAVEEGSAAETPASDANGTAEAKEPESSGNSAAAEGKKQPAFKVGPIPTGKGESVSGCVWENEHATSDGRTYTVHAIVLDVSYFSEKDGKWLPSKSIRPSQLAAVEYVLRVCGDFAFRRRDPQQECPF